MESVKDKAIVNRPRPGSRFGGWVVPKGCLRVCLGSDGRPIWSIVE